MTESLKQDKSLNAIFSVSQKKVWYFLSVFFHAILFFAEFVLFFIAYSFLYDYNDYKFSIGANIWNRQAERRIKAK